MYPVEHDKLVDRTYSNNPEVGIPIALETLNDPESHYYDLISAACHLCYRVLDKTYHDIEYAEKHLLRAIELTDSIPEQEPEWIKTRWKVSISVVYAYFQVLVKNQPLPRKILEECVSETHVSNHPMQMVNVLRAQLLLLADELLALGRVDLQICHEIVEKYSMKAIALFRLGSEKFVLNPHEDYIFNHCFSESMQCINEILKFKFCYNPETASTIEKIIQAHKNLAYHPFTKEFLPFRLCIVELHNRSKARRLTRKVDQFHRVFDIQNNRVAYCHVPKSASRTVIGWSALLKNPNIYKERPDLFEPRRKDMYQELRNAVNEMHSIRDMLNAEVFFTIVRDPIDRFVSAYKNRILYLNKCPEVSFGEFVLNYEKFKNDGKYSDIIHHTKPITFFCGKDPSIFTHIFNTNQLDKVKILLENIYGVQLPDIVLNKSDENTKLDISDRCMEKLQSIYAEDYNIYGRWFEEKIL
jgi:hypothetical protein